MAEAAGMKVGDTLEALDTWSTRSAAELQVALRSAGRGGMVTMRFARDGASLERTVPAVRFPMEEGVRYDAVERAGVRLRTMIDAAVEAGPSRRPAVLFVQGLSNATMETTFPALFRGWRDEGFVTMRLERRGVGDSEGDAPEQGDLLADVADVRAALLALSHHELVDPDAVFVFGHSVGGMIAPLLDADDLLRGYIVYGTTAEPWFDCLEASARRQWTLRGAEDVDTHVQAFRDALRTQDVVDGRSALYHRQLDEAELASAWSRVRKPVLVMHGAHDWVVSEREARHVAQVTGGTFLPLPRLDHLLSAHDSIEASVRSYGSGVVDPSLVHEMCAWMRSVTRVGSG
jgi:hypothetical protein